MAQIPAGISTRERILAYLSENHIATAAVLSRATRLTGADIRYHLSGLLDDGLVERVPPGPGASASPAPSARRGRPAVAYRLAAAAQTNNLAGLAAALLDVLGESALPAVAEALAGKDLPNLAAPRIQRLHGCANTLSASGYRASWEAGPNGPRVLLRACPYAAILTNHPELCKIDRLLVERLSGLEFTQTARIDPHTGRPPACVFIAHT
jgi:predicted ArsR family transcriptional regulator